MYSNNFKFIRDDSCLLSALRFQMQPLLAHTLYNVLITKSSLFYFFKYIVIANTVEKATTGPDNIYTCIHGFIFGCVTMDTTYLNKKLDHRFFILFI